MFTKLSLKKGNILTVKIYQIVFVKKNAQCMHSIDHGNWKKEKLKKKKLLSFPCGSGGKESSYNTRDTGDVGSTPGLGRSLGEGNGNLSYDSCLENPMDWGAWGATVQRVVKSRTPLST